MIKLIRPELKAASGTISSIYKHPYEEHAYDARQENLSTMMNIQRKVKMFIRQLVKQFQVQTIKNKDLWHLCAKVGKKILKPHHLFYV